VSSRATAIAFALLAIVLTLAQDVVPARDWYHGWKYIVVLALAIAVMAGYAWQARGGADGVAGRRLSLALAGAIAAGVTGLLSGLIGPDTVTVIGTPGTVTPLPDLGVAAFFNAVDPAQLARGDATVLLRRRDASAVEVGAWPVPLGLSVVYAQPRPAAYVVARDAHGNRLTVTQPANASFLSPVILFRQTQAIHDRTFPLDTVAVPAAHRIVRVLYFSPADLAAFGRTPAPGSANQPAAVLSVADDAGAPEGIAMAQSGRAVDAGGVNLTITLGTYPVLQVASAPQFQVMVGGVLLFVLAAAWSFVPKHTPRANEVTAPLSS
jgi:hypothetical protein